MDLEVFTIAEAAALCKVSERTIRRAIANGHLKAGRLGETCGLRITREALEDWFEVRSTLHEPRAVKAIPVLPSIGSRPAPRKPRPAGSLNVFGTKAA